MGKRLFIAVKIIPDGVFMNHLLSLQQKLQGERIKWVEAQNIHITLKFLGDTNESKVSMLQHSLEGICTQFHSITFFLKDLGIFGSHYHPKVIWIGIEPFEEIKELMIAIHQSLEKVGFPVDRQNLVPHLTLGRIKELNNPTFFWKIFNQYKSISSKQISINDIVLYESILKKEGPLYINLTSCSLIQKRP